MKITFFIGGLSGGGAERVVCNLSNYLSLQGHEVAILTMSDDAPTYSLSNSIKRTCLLKTKERSNFLINTLKRLARFISFLRKHNTDVYIVFLPITTILLLRLRFLVKVKIIAAERNDPSIYSVKTQKQLKKLACQANGWVFQTNEQRQWFGNATRNAQTQIIPNAINPEFVKPIYLGERRKAIVTAGRLTDQKNHKLLIEAFALLAENNPDYQLVIYGDGPKKDELAKLIASKGLNERVVLAGYTTEIGDKIKDASMFVLSSDYEGMPNALMEAMALGLPCVSTDCGGGGARFLIEDGVNGLLVPCGDAQALAAAMEKVLSNKLYADAFGKKAHDICERLASKKIYGEWEAFIKQIAVN